MGICSWKKRAPVSPQGLQLAGPGPSAEERGLEAGLGVEVAVRGSAEELEDHYEACEGSLGRGRFGAVGLVRSRRAPHLVFALKTVQAADGAAGLEREARVWRELDHPCLVRLADCFATGTQLHFVMELCAGGDLVSRLVEAGGLPEATVQRHAFRLLLGLRHMHAKHLLHRDVKPDNLLLDQPPGQPPALKLADFGLSKRLVSARPNSVVGTAYYAAPEVFDREYGFPVDSWSVGATLYTLLAARPPFVGRDNRETLHLAASADLAFDQPAWKHVSAQARDFLSRLLAKEPSQRLSLAEALRHPWLAEADLEAALRARKAAPAAWQESLACALRFSPAKLALCCLAVRLGLPDRLEAAAVERWFFLFDEDRLGEVSVGRFEAVARSLGSPLSTEDAGLLLRAARLRPSSEDQLSFSLFSSLLSSHRHLESQPLLSMLFHRVAGARTKVTRKDFTQRLAQLTGWTLPEADSDEQLLERGFVDLI